MTIRDYIKKYGNKTFKEVEFNNVDNCLFSYLAYLNLYDIVSSSSINKISLGDVGKKFFKKYTTKQLKFNIVAVNTAIELFKEMYNSPRYKDILLYNYVYASDDEDLQFSALFIDYTEKNTYIAFEGTDALISGWREDFELSYTFPIKSHILAVNYINKKIPFFSPRQYILGGHSKGGNLALVSGMYCKKSRQKKIIRIMSNDGPGLAEKEMYSKEFKEIASRYQLIVPDQSIVGLILKQPANYYVVKSTKKGLIAHNIINWVVYDTDFKESTLSDFSNALDDTIDLWLDTFNIEERRDFVNNFFDIFKRLNILSILDLKEKKLTSFIKIIKETKNINKKSRDMMLMFIKIFASSIKIDFLK